MMRRSIRSTQLESLEARRLFNVDPIRVGSVYVEEDSGSDAHGDSFYVTFEGGAPGTQLSRLVIRTDQGGPGFTVADNFFDTVDGGRGADHAYPFRIESINTVHPGASVSAQVTDGGMELILNFQNFFAGDRIRFSIDVDEVQHLYSSVDIAAFNEGLDPITSGAEFEGSTLVAQFIAPRFENASIEGRFINRYDSIVGPADLDLPTDNAGGLRDRTAGVAVTVQQRPKPIALGGTVFVDNNLDLNQDPSEVGIAGVRLELYRLEGDRFVATGYRTTTDASGRYEFGLNLGLLPGTYRIVETQPLEYFSVGAVPGLLNGEILLGESVPGNPDVLTEIAILEGDSRGTELNFAEAQPARIAGYVYLDNNNDGIRGPQESGLADVVIRLTSISTLTGEPISRTTRTNNDGSYAFLTLPPGVYTISEVQPSRYLDGIDSVGFVGTESRGRILANDELTEIVLDGNDSGVEYNFGEIEPSSLSGRVCAVVPGYGCFSEEPGGSLPLSGVRIDLIGDGGKVVATTFTSEDGRYRFDELPPGVYSIIETQPVGLFDGGTRAGTIEGTQVGSAASGTKIVSIALQGGQDGIHYDFCEVRPAAISGYVFKDGEDLITPDGLPPEDLRGVRDGLRTSDDLPLEGVVLELRRVDGSPVSTQDALPGSYEGNEIRVRTNSQGYYEFTGLRPGKYHVYQVQPEGYFDGRDTAGNTGGVADNPFDPILDPAIEALLELLRRSPSTDPQRDGIVMIDAVSALMSIENNFSEIVTLPENKTPPPEPPPPDPPPPDPQPVPPIERPPTPPARVPEGGSVPPPVSQFLILTPPAGRSIDAPLAGYAVEYAWHLSIINAGEPRGYRSERKVDPAKIASAAKLLDIAQWSIDTLNRGKWYIVSKSPAFQKHAFGARGAKQLAGDFNGDGRDELALFLHGEWLLDINGNGEWDRGDMWLRLGDRGDLPVVGDWDGDGKDDIGIYGAEWTEDGERIPREPGLPDPTNRHLTRPKNIPEVASQDAEDATEERLRVRLMQRSAAGEGRADPIDHIFRFGDGTLQPVAGDFNGSGISKIGIFRDGRWKLDIDGDGRFESDRDVEFVFGKAGDIAIVGDFNGDGLDEIAVVRGNQVIIDSNGNGRLDSTDRIFQIEGDGDGVVVGDFDGDGIDEAAFYSIGRDNQEGIRQAKAG
jgi:serine-aspartate repeat-containing protein C/D/E